MENQKKLIGKKFKEIRKRTQCTQEYFAEQIGIEPSSLSNIENGKSFPSMQTVLNLMDKFNISFNDFFDNDYLMDEQQIEDKIIDIVKSQSYSNKQIIYRLIKQFIL